VILRSGEATGTSSPCGYPPSGSQTSGTGLAGISAASHGPLPTAHDLHKHRGRPGSSAGILTHTFGTRGRAGAGSRSRRDHARYIHPAPAHVKAEFDAARDSIRAQPAYLN
jgi:hypothetical protein